MASRHFTLFHLNLSRLRQQSLLAFEGDRESWLRHALSETFEFEYRGGNTMHWVPRDPIDECIFGLLEQRKPHEHHEPPEKGGAEIVSDSWQGAYVLLDPTAHDEGQRAAVENDVVGAPNSIVTALAKAINRRSDASFEIEVEPISVGARFWGFARKHNNVLQRITFDFAVPNMWGAESDLEQDLKDTGEQTGASRVKTELRSDAGVAVENEIVREGVSYAEKGAGRVTARAQDGELFSSTRQAKSTKIPLIQGAKDQIRKSFESLKGTILGHEQDYPLDPTDSAGDGALDDQL